MTDDVMLIGEGFAGDGVNAAHVNIVMGPRSGPVGTAWATALATPATGHVPFVAVAAPGIQSRAQNVGNDAALTWAAGDGC